MKRVLPLMVLLLAGLSLRAEEPKVLNDVPYGKHPASGPGFLPGQVGQADAGRLLHPRRRLARRRQEDCNPKPFLDKGISVVAINYRYVKNGVEDKVEPPVKAPLEDAARALQFVRSKAAEWNIDKKRIGATGGSAGGCSSLWLAFHDDMADPKSKRPDRPRIDPALLCGGQRRPDLARSEGAARLDAELRLRRPRLRSAELPEPDRQSRKGPEVDQGIFADRARHQGRSADRPVLRRRQGREGRRFAEGSRPIRRSWASSWKKSSRPLASTWCSFIRAGPTRSTRTARDYLIDRLLK